MSPSALFPWFSQKVPTRGYRWWYIDGSSDDGAHHIVVIAFIGSVFSPFYKRAADKGPADPMDFCAINVALYSKRQARWVMSECRKDSVQCETSRFRVSNSCLDVSGDTLTISVDEIAAPLPQAVKGRIVVNLDTRTTKEHALDAAARHHWWPVSPSARIQVHFDRPDLRWTGHGYVDSNRGSEPLHEGFDDWHWSRTHHAEHTHLTYRSTDRAGNTSALGLNISADGQLSETPLPDASLLPASPIWRAPRVGYLPGNNRVVRTLEDTPFYARSITTSDANPAIMTMHESLSLQRFRSNWVTTLIPFRMRFPLRR